MIARATRAAITSERETALRHLQEGELVLRLLADHFQRAKSRLEEAFHDVEKLKEDMEREGIDTMGSRMSPEPPIIISNIETGQGSPAHSVNSRDSSHDADIGDESS